MRTLQKWRIGLLGLFLLIFTACVEKQKKEEQQEEESKVVKAPQGIISLKEAKILCDNYEDFRRKPIREFERVRNPEKEFVPTQFIDFDFKTIKQYVKYVERRARKAGVKPDSLRVYLGNYGKDGRDPNRNTVFVVPTASIDGTNGGFYIDADGKAKLIRNYWPKNENDDHNGQQKSEASLLPSFNTMFYQDGSLILNFGHGGPPPTGDF